jgi:rubredoxin
MTKITYRCKRCLHEWIPKIPEDIPKICPRCKSKKWNEINNIKPLLNIPAPGRGAELKQELIDEQAYLAAKKTVDDYDAQHGGPGTLKRTIEILARMRNVTYDEYMNNGLGTETEEERKQAEQKIKERLQGATP